MCFFYSRYNAKKSDQMVSVFTTRKLNDLCIEDQHHLYNAPAFEIIASNGQVTVDGVGVLWFEVVKTQLDPTSDRVLLVITDNDELLFYPLATTGVAQKMLVAAPRTSDKKNRARSMVEAGAAGDPGPRRFSLACGLARHRPPTVLRPRGPLLRVNLRDIASISIRNSTKATEPMWSGGRVRVYVEPSFGKSGAFRGAVAWGCAIGAPYDAPFFCEILFFRRCCCSDF